MSRVLKLAPFNITKFTKLFESNTVSLRFDIINKDFSKAFILPSNTLGLDDYVYKPKPTSLRLFKE